MDAGQVPKTSLPGMLLMSYVLDRIRSDGYKRVIAVMLSSGLSGTFNMVCQQSKGRNDLDVRVYDSLNGASGMRITVLQLWEDIQSGMDWETLTTRRVPQLIANTYPFFTVNTLEYLAKGGRIGKITALTGSMPNIKPIIRFSEDGQLQSVARVRGERQAQNKIVELCRKLQDGHRRYNIGIEHGGAPEAMAQMREKMLAAFPDSEHCWEGTIDATLSVYIGKGVVGAGIQLLD